MALRLRMLDKLDEATELARKVSDKARLVSIVGICLHDDGAVHLGKKDDWFSRWQYAYMVDDGGDPPRFVTAIYMRSGEPLVDSNAGNVSNMVPFDEETVTGLNNSSMLVSKFNVEGDHTPMKGGKGDLIVVFMERMLSPMAILQNGKRQCLRIDPVTLERL